MATELKRFTISITPTMEVVLDKAKKNCYYKDTQSEMIRDLINRGLKTLNLNRMNELKEQEELQ